jgi:hypothetical protein
MATLENVNGASLVPNFNGGLNMLNQAFGQRMDRKRAEEAQQAQQQQIQQILGGGQGGQSGATPGFNGNVTPEQILRIGQIDPKMAEMMQGMLERNDKVEMEQAKAEVDRGTREATLISNAKTPAERMNVLNNLAAAAAAEGRPVTRYVDLMNMSPDQQELELERMKVMGADMQTLLAPPKPPETDEIKTADKILTRQFNPESGQMEVIAEAARFNPNAGTNVRVDVNSGGESKEREEIAKIDAKQYGQVLEKASNSQETLDNLSQLELIDVQTGALEPAKVAMAAIVEGFGVDASGIANVSNAQAYNAVANTLVNKVLNAAKGPQTEQDAARARQTIANLGDTPEGGKFKINAMKALAMRDIEMADFIQSKMDAQRENDEIVSFSKARTEWNNFKRETPLLSSAVKNPATGLPVFFYEFKENAQRKRPGITEQEVIEAWRKINE